MRLVRNALVVFMVPLCAGLLGGSWDGPLDNVLGGLMLSVYAAALPVIPMLLACAPVFVIALVARSNKQRSGTCPPLHWRGHLRASAGPILKGFLAYGALIGTLLLIWGSSAPARSSRCDVAACLGGSPSLTFSEALMAAPAVGLGLLLIALAVVIPVTTSFLAVTETLP